MTSNTCPSCGQPIVDLSHIAQRIRIARKNAKMSQRKLGELCGHPNAVWINAIESDRHRVSAEDLGLIAHHLGKDISYFYNESIVSTKE